MEIDDVYKLPYEEWRKGQKEIVDRVAELYESEFPIVILEAPTGSGKSAVAVAVANKLDLSWWYVTNTIQLQYQVEDDFDATSIMGRRNYTCWMNPDLTAAECPYAYSEDDCPSKDMCDYLLDRQDAINSDKVVFNYQYFLSIMNHTNLFGDAGLCILDEVHSLEEQLMKFVSAKFSFFDFSMMRQDFPEDEDVDEALTRIKDGYAKVCEEFEDLKDEIQYVMDDTEKLEETMKKAYKYRALKRKIDFILDYFDSSWVFEFHFDEEEATRSWMSFKPTRVDNFVDRILHTDRLLMMSATVGAKNVFCKNLGMKAKYVPKLETESMFKKERRPLIYDPACKMSKGKLDETKMLNKIDEILEREEELGKGIIHTVSYDVQRKILMSSMHNNRLISHESQNRVEQLNKYRNSRDNVVLVSPSMNEGVDLKYDELNFQIIVKIPFLYLGDKQIKKRMENDKLWYTQQTINKLVQTYGRGMRAEDDFCATYIIDKNFSWIVDQYEWMFPDWFLESITKQRPNMEKYKER